MKCPNCSSTMLVADQNATPKSLVKFYRCTNCVGRHVSSEPLNSFEIHDHDIELFASRTTAKHKIVHLV